MPDLFLVLPHCISVFLKLFFEFLITLIILRIILCTCLFLKSLACNFSWGPWLVRFVQEVIGIVGFKFNKACDILVEIFIGMGVLEGGRWSCLRIIFSVRMHEGGRVVSPECGRYFFGIIVFHCRWSSLVCDRSMGESDQSTLMSACCHVTIVIKFWILIVSASWSLTRGFKSLDSLIFDRCGRDALLANRVIINHDCSSSLRVAKARVLKLLGKPLGCCSHWPLLFRPRLLIVFIKFHHRPIIRRFLFPISSWLALSGCR